MISVPTVLLKPTIIKDASCVVTADGCFAGFCLATYIVTGSTDRYVGQTVADLHQVRLP